MRHVGHIAPSGHLGIKVFRAPKQGWRGFVTHALPHRGLPAEVNRWRLRNLCPTVSRDGWRIMFQGGTLLQALRVVPVVKVGRRGGAVKCYGRLSVRVVRDGVTIDYGIASYRLVTTAGVGFIVDAFQNLVELENMKYHGYGTGTTAEASGDTALVTELTTEYPTDNTRITGSQTENGANVYRTVATLDPDADVALTEHGIFSQAATGGGVLLDRSKFSVINLTGATGDTMQTTYDFTINAGG